MSQEFPGRRTLESFKKEAKRWFAALRDDVPEARARFQRTLPEFPASSSPTLREVRHALAREQGFAGWAELKGALGAGRLTSAPTRERYEIMAKALLEAYRSGTPEAMERHYRFTWHRRNWKAMRTYVQLDLGKQPRGADDDVEITLDDARYLVAVEHGYESWDALLTFVASSAARSVTAVKPVRLVHANLPDDTVPSPIAYSRDWNRIIGVLAAHPDACLCADGQMTDDVLERVCRVDCVTALDLGGSQRLTDEGLRHLARLRRLRHLDLRGTAITDRGVAVLGELPALETISLAHTRISDAGVASLAPCQELRRVDLSGTRTGDGAIRSLAGKADLHELMTGDNVSDAGIPLLSELPRFRRWQGGETSVALMGGRRSLPNYLSLRGAFTDRGMTHLRALDGLFALDLDNRDLAITAAALPPLVALPNLGWLAVDAKDDWMPLIAEMPQLRYLRAQDTVAGDEGFVALSKSRTLEYIWGRRCHNLHRRGFMALAAMPALRGLSVSCLNVDDSGIAALPSFPALKELMPMDIPDAGYQHIGRCPQLESLILMYCRHTTDAATERVTGLSKLNYYFNSYTTITDRTPELLARMDSLERVTFDACHALTNTGVAKLARLPALRELRVSGRGVTADVVGAFPTRVRVHQG